MVAYHVETEDLAGIVDQLLAQADGLVATRDGVSSASLEMLHTVAAGITSTTAQVQQVFAALGAATRAAASAADSAEWDGPDAEEFRSSNAALLEAITASEQRLQEAVTAHSTSTAQLDSVLRGTLGEFSTEAGRNHDLTAQLGQAVGEERTSLERAFDGTWSYTGEGTPPPGAVPPPPAPEPPAPEPPAPEEEEVSLGDELKSAAAHSIPFIGTGLGIAEWFTGRDLITDRQLGPVDHASVFAGPVLGLLKLIGRGLALGARWARGGRAGAGKTRAASEGPGAGRGEQSIVGKADPVDITTGRVFLPQTDVQLLGALPLVIGRRFDSGYRLGRSFGPTWATVLDERIEFDDHGAMLVRSDGATLAYPLPAPGGEAVLPGSGTSRWPLTLDTEGVFRVTDPVSGISYLYQAAPAPDGDAAIDSPTDSERDPAWLLRVEDRAGRWWAIVRDPECDGVPLLVVHHGGYLIAVRTDEYGRVLALDTPDPDDESCDARLGAYGYDDAGNLDQVLTATRGSLRFRYDDRGRMTEWVDSNDRAYEYSYDDHDRCMSQGAAGGVMAFSYAYTEDPAAGRVETILTDPLGHRSRFVADASTRLLLEEIDPAGGVTRHSYDECANPVSRTDPTGPTTRWTWDDRGRLTGTTDPLGAVTTVQHDAGDGGHDLVITGPDGAAITYGLGETGEVSAVIDASGAVTTIETDAATGNLRVIDPLGGVTSTTLDRAGLPLTVTDATGGTTTIVRDGLGRPVQVTDPVGTVTSTTWRIDGRPLTRTALSGSDPESRESWEWDGAGNCTRYTDPAGRVSTTEFGDFDRPLARTAPDGSRIAFVHDQLLRPVRIVNQLGDAWTLEYDPNGNVVSETDYAGRRIVREFDLAGRLTLEVNGADQARSYAYDPAGRIESITSDGEVARFGYDAAGRLVTAAGPDVAVERSYDLRGLLTAETVNSATTTWRYDAAGQIIGRTTPAGVDSTRAYDDAGHLVSLATAGHQLSLSHDLAGREVARVVAPLAAGAGVVIASEWTPIGRLASRGVRAGSDSSSAGTTDWSVRYGYTPVGELAARADSALGTSRYELDAAGRVTTVSTGDGSNETATAYGYDAAGNLIAHEPSSPGGQGRTATGRAWAYLRGRLTRAGRDRYVYDDQGRLVRRRRALLSGGSRDWTYTWDAADRLTRVTTPDGSTWLYTYDPFGRRIAKRQILADGMPGEHVSFVWEGADLIEQTTTDPATGAVASVSWDRMPDGSPATHTTTRRDGSDMPDNVAGDTPASDGTGCDGDPASWDQGRIDFAFYALVTDLVGAPIRAVTPDGDAAWVARPTLWNPGSGAASDRGVDVPLRFPGQYADAETGLFYNVNRYYDPDTARYISPDPLGLAPAPNAYTYPVNPTTHIDPLGLDPQRPPSGAPKGESAALRPLTASERATLEDALRPDKLKHVFDPKHKFDPLIQQFGSREAVMEQFVRNIGGPLPQSGFFEVARSVGGQSVVIRGAVVDGIPRIGTVFTP